MFRPSSVVRNAVAMPELLALIDYLTNEILILGRITFFNQTDSTVVLQPLRWRCIECVIHYERDVRDE